MKRKFLIAWILILATLLCACNLKNGGEETETNGNDAVVARTVELAANGKALYKIILPEQVTGEVSRAADKLRNKLKTLTGVLFSITDDYTQGGAVKDSEGEIIIGDCKRTEMQSELSNLSYRDYSVTVTDHNILIAGYENSKVADAAAVLARVKATFPDNFELDGVSVDRWDAEGWWFNVRMSNTEPLVRLNLEAKTPDLMAAKRDEMLALIRQ
jgi:hypothetical protein